MSKLKVDIDRVNDLTPSFSQVTTKVSNTTDKVASIRSQIDYRIKARHGIGDQLYKISNELQTIEKNMQKLVSFLQNSMDKYAEAEQKIARQVPMLLNVIGKNNKSIDENDSMKINDAQSDTSESDDSNPFIETWNSFKEIGKDFFDGLEERGEKALDSPYDFFNYLSIGALDGLNSGLKSRNEKKFDSTYDFFNYLTLGFTDTAKEAILPEDPFSKEHWLNSLGVVTTVAGLKGATPKTGSLKNGNDIKVLTNKTSGSVQAGIEDLSIDKYLNQIKNNIQELTNVAGNGLNMMPATGVATGAGVTMMKGLDNFQGLSKTAVKTENTTKPVDKIDEGNIKGIGANKIASEPNPVSKYDDFYSYDYNSLNNPGPLAKFRGQPNKNFYGGRYNIEVLTKPKIFYRAGDINSPLGQWFTEKPPSSIAEVRIDTAVKEQWIDKNGVLTGTSRLNTVFKIEIPAGTTIYKGPVGSQGGIYQGGLDIIQIYIKEPWNIEEGVKVIGSWPLK
ncbi:hypothetical protein H9636_14575 [Ureibacillus sp. Re31]|uniref:LXG domain-containing protein n=1 Tax=Ureibacillus galli TaxID=2762222 RepID=A0ABR8XFC5_9BACL|nr:hypothetical protein [Ureibacillus galli]MBD8027874.1 hypothetical protein [Ureibacillus galli]